MWETRVKFDICLINVVSWEQIGLQTQAGRIHILSSLNLQQDNVIVSAEC